MKQQKIAEQLTLAKEAINEAEGALLENETAPALIKATFYLTEDDIMQLEHIRLARRSRGMRVDKSALIREAIRLLQP